MASSNKNGTGNFMKWLRWIGSAGSPRKQMAQPAEETDTPQDAFNLGSQTVLSDAVECARHALVMEFRAKHKFDPTQEDLSDWVNSIWLDRGQMRGIIQNRNPMALALGERFPDFWPALKDAALKPVRKMPS